jgi:hypothetical protein
MYEFTKIQMKRLHEIAAKTPSIRPFEKDTPAAKASRVEKVTDKGWEAFKFFCQTYLPHIVTKPFSRDHSNCFNEIEANINGITGITGYRGFSKTMLFGPSYTIWKLINGVIYAVCVSADQEISEERTFLIWNELENNVRIKNDFPEMKIIDGKEDDFYLKNKARIRARSIAQFRRGSLNPKTGKRVDLVDVDDIDKDENIGNYTIGKRKLDKVLGAIFGSKNPENDFICTWKGNLTHPNLAICQFEDLLFDEMKAERPGLEMKDVKHLRSGGKIMLRYPVERSDGTSVWPEQYSDAELVKMRQDMGQVNYLREMMGKKIIEGKIFKFEWFKRWRQLPKTRGCFARLYADLAPGEKSCYKAFLGGFRNEKKYYVTNLRVRQENDGAFFRAYYDAFQELSEKFGSRFRAYVEGNFSQYRYFIRDFDLFCQAKGLPSITHKIRKYDNTGKKTERIESMETIIEQGKILFPDGQDVKTLEEQFLAYPDGFMDGPDATEGWLQQFPGYNPRRGKARFRRM